jgi:hypothetical protein
MRREKREGRREKREGRREKGEERRGEDGPLLPSPFSLRRSLLMGRKVVILPCYKRLRRDTDQRTRAA